MQNIKKIGSITLLIAILCFSLGTAVLASTTPQIQTVAASNIQNGSATLNANISDLGAYGSATFYFQWGTDASYGNQTTSITQGYIGFYNQPISGLAPYATYHYRAVAQNSYGTVYGQDMTFVSGQSASYGAVVSVQTTYATYISNFQATLNGTISGNNSAATNYVYFQWGTTTGYGTETPQQSIGYAANFMQNIANINAATTYHYRAVAQGTYGTVYGQDMTFTTSGVTNSYNNSSLSVVKRAVNLGSGNLNWSSLVSANPSDTLSFSITLQANGQDIHNVIVRDALPVNIIYKGSLMVNSNSNYGGDIMSGLNIGTIYAGQSIVISYQAQIAPAGSFSFGATTLNNNAIVTSTEAGTQTSSASVLVNKSLVYGASTVSTGLTNNFLTDSFFLPLLIIIAGLWLYFSGNIYYFASWINPKK
ncbi:MAG: hypothetical protein NTY04_04610 [Candidatus Staskawiczbacteria bacterium]|nr:hypothetical protein [Candidatus Staskawiczbacteria bacterium]